MLIELVLSDSAQPAAEIRNSCWQLTTLSSHRYFIGLGTPPPGSCWNWWVSRNLLEQLAATPATRIRVGAFTYVCHQHHITGTSSIRRRIRLGLKHEGWSALAMLTKGSNFKCPRGHFQILSGRYRRWVLNRKSYRVAVFIGDYTIEHLIGKGMKRIFFLGIAYYIKRHLLNHSSSRFLAFDGHPPSRKFRNHPVNSLYFRGKIMSFSLGTLLFEAFPSRQPLPCFCGPFRTVMAGEKSGETSSDVRYASARRLTCWNKIRLFCTIWQFPKSRQKITTVSK